MAPTGLCLQDSSVVLNLIRRVRTKKKNLCGKDYKYRVKAMLQSTEKQLLSNLRNLTRRLSASISSGSSDNEQNGEIDFAGESEEKSGGNDDVLSLNSFFEKLYSS